jgi:hypothetical protein
VWSAHRLCLVADCSDVEPLGFATISFAEVQFLQIMHHRKEPQLKCVCVTWNFCFKVLVLTEHHTNLKVWGVKDTNMQKCNRMQLVNRMKISL